MNERTIQRVILALEPASDNRRTISTAVALARQLEVSLEGVFVEDINLLHYSSLPFARIVSHAHTRAEPVNPANMERALRMQAQRLHRLVNEIAGQSSLSAAFKTLRGDVATSLTSASASRDLLIINRAAGRHRERQLGRTARTLMSTATASVLILHPSRVPERPVVVLFDGTAQSRRALQLAIQLAQTDEQHLSVIYPAVDENLTQQFQQTVDEQLRQTGIKAKYMGLSANTPGGVLRCFEQAAGRILLLDAQSPYFDPTAYESIALGLNAPLLLVR